MCFYTVFKPDDSPRRPKHVAEYALKLSCIDIGLFTSHGKEPVPVPICLPQIPHSGLEFNPGLRGERPIIIYSIVRDGVPIHTVSYSRKLVMFGKNLLRLNLKERDWRKPRENRLTTLTCFAASVWVSQVEEHKVSWTHSTQGRHGKRMQGNCSKRFQGKTGHMEDTCLGERIILKCILTCGTKRTEFILLRLGTDNNLLSTL